MRITTVERQSVFPRSGRPLAALVAVLLCAAPAGAEPPVEDEAPRVIELAHIDVAGGPFGFTFWLGARTWIGGRHHVAARVGAHRLLLRRDLDGDGTEDFSGKNSGTHLEVQLEAGWPLRVHRDVVGHELRSTVKRIVDGQPLEQRTYAARIARITTLSIVTGARVAIDPNAIQVGVPVGVRWDRHRRTRDVARYAERWAQLRAIVFPQAPGVGFDAEVGWLPLAFGVAGFVEYVPAHHDTEAFTCRPTSPRSCTPDHPITAFDRIPFESRLTFGIRLVIHLPR